MRTKDPESPAPFAQTPLPQISEDEFDKVIVGPPKGSGPPEFFPKVEIFHKNEGEIYEEIKQTYLGLGGDVDDLDVVELLLPAVQFDSFVFLKVEIAPEEEGTLQAILSDLSEDGDVLLPAVQSADHTADDVFDKSTPKLMIKFDGSEGDAVEMPEQSAWAPLNDFSDDVLL